MEALSYSHGCMPTDGQCILPKVGLVEHRLASDPTLHDLQYKLSGLKWQLRSDCSGVVGLVRRTAFSSFRTVDEEESQHSSGAASHPCDYPLS